MLPYSNPILDRNTNKRTFNPAAKGSKSGLAVDTSFSRHEGQEPQQVFPYESQTQELSFVGPSDVEALKKESKRGLKQHLERRYQIQPRLQRTVSDKSVYPAANSDIIVMPVAPSNQIATSTLTNGSQTSRPLFRDPPLHKRIKGLRPAPLDLTQDVSPSDRAITIGLAVPSTAMSTHTQSPLSPTHLKEHPLRHVEEAHTPTIVITPAKDDFSIVESPEELKHTSGRRPTPSIYSSCTNYLSRPTENGRPRPPPPLPLFVSQQASRESAATVFEGDATDLGTNSRGVSMCATSEDAEAARLPRSSKHLTSQSQVPPGRRSKGWWNIITSPFSAGSKSDAFFWRSPSLPEDGEDRQRILDYASSMGECEPHAGVIFTNRAPDDGELRTALPPDTGSEKPSMPRRSDTAPGALDTCATSINIYRIPSQGLAAAYYDLNRHFPSLLLENAKGNRVLDDLEGWSPSQSVVHPEQPYHSSPASDAPVADGILGAGERATDDHDQDTKCTSVEGGKPVEGPHQAESPGTDRNIFSTPSEEELGNKHQPTCTNGRSDAQPAGGSYVSPLTTPVIEDAYVATIRSSHKEPKEIEMPSRAPSLPPPVLATTGTTSRDNSEAETSKKAPSRPLMHVWNISFSSVGLGISDVGSEKDSSQFTNSQAERAAPRDHFDHRVARDINEQSSRVPWHRRFLWLLITISACLILLLAVLLVIFIPQKRNDMPVQAQWLNLTGFPPMPTGITTVIQPAKSNEISECVSPKALWGCASPDVSQSNFRFEIRFRNGTFPKNETRPAKRDVYTARPSVPSKDDRLFLGQYTDNLTSPYDGDETPFYISLLNASALIGKSSKMSKRQNDPYPYPTSTNSSSHDISTNASTTAAKSIPQPLLGPNGKPQQANLYPFAEAQPLRLFNQGLDEEHYGFYTYFDRSIYVSNTSSSTISDSAQGGNFSSNVDLDDALAVCVWSQTRFHVKIWTRKSDVASLGDPIPLNGLSAVNSTANQMTPPGSFPYPVTITLDRHGGSATEKGVYCYGLNEEHRVVESVKTWVDEDRAFDGALVNPAAVPSSNGTSLTKRNQGEEYGGIDGGTGGCTCQWQNWH